MIKFEIENGILKKISKSKNETSPKDFGIIKWGLTTIKIPNDVIEIEANVLDKSLVGVLWGIAMPKSVKKINHQAFTNIKEGNKISLFFETEEQLAIAQDLENKSFVRPKYHILYTLFETNKEIEEIDWFLQKLAFLEFKNITESNISFANSVITADIAHKNYKILNIIIDNPWYGRRGHDGEDESEDYYSVNPQNERIDISRIRKLFD
jgi:hypothetical protein